MFYLCSIWGRLLSRELSDAGFWAEFPPPMERRGVGQDVVHVAIEVASQAKDGLIGAAATEAVRRIVRAFKERYPGVTAEVKSDEDE
jgi:hypothetical protein